MVNHGVITKIWLRKSWWWNLGNWGNLWCINAKNSFYSIHGFSPYQLTTGKNLKLPSTINKKASALTGQPVSKIVSSNLEAIRRARHLVASNISQGTLSTISAWTAENGIDQPKYLAKTANKCLSKTDAILSESTLVTFNSLTKNAKTTKMHQLQLAYQSENDKHDPQPHNKINKNQHYLNIENWDSKNEDPNIRKSTNQPR